MKKTFAEREELILKLFSDAHYVPMKEKELAILLRVEPEDREELSNVLKRPFGRYFYQAFQGVWLCGSRRNGRGFLYSGIQSEGCVSSGYGPDPCTSKEWR